MKQLATVVTALAMVLAIGGCKKEKGKGDGSGNEPTAGKTTTPLGKKAWTSADSVEAYKACLAAFNAHDIAKFQDCFADDGAMQRLDFVGPSKMAASGPAAIAEMVKTYASAFPDVEQEPQLVVGTDNRVAAIVLESGTNSGELMGRPATDKKTSVLLAQAVLFNDDGKIRMLATLGDQATYGHQLGIEKSETAPDAAKAWDKPVTAAADDADKDENTTNADLVKNVLDAMDKLDAGAIMPHVADNAELRYAPHKDAVTGKDAYKKGLEEYLGASAGMHHEINGMVAAGGWVGAWMVADNELEKDMPGMKGTKGKKTELNQIVFWHMTDDKIDQEWVFENSRQLALQAGLIEPVGGDEAKEGADEGETNSCIL